MPPGTLMPECESHLTCHFVLRVPQLAPNPVPSTPAFWPPTARGAASAANNTDMLKSAAG
jgi:hypothetical protein